MWTTAWGPIGAVANPDGTLRRLILPHYQANDLADLLAWEHPATVRDPKPFEPIIERSRAYFNGQAVEFQDIPCDLPGEAAFAGMVLRACRALGYGQRTNYGSIAKQIDRPDAARAVATALSKNDIPLVIPCHRVTYSGGGLGGFSAAGGVDVKRRMLDLEKSGGSNSGA